MTNSRLCQGCRQPFPVSPRERNPRRWCTNACRRWTIAHPGESRPTERTCAGCGADISTRPAQARYCSKRCNEVTHGKRLPEVLPPADCALPECGETFQPWRSGQRCCSEKHSKLLYNRESRADGRQKALWNDKRRDNYHRRRALKKAASTGEPVLLADIAERDGWECQICHEPVDPLLKWPDAKSPSLDHRIPLSRGGVHDPSNVDLAHLGCNTAKHNRVDEELSLAS